MSVVGYVVEYMVLSVRLGMSVECVMLSVWCWVCVLGYMVLNMLLDVCCRV